MTTVEMVVKPTKATIRGKTYLKKSSFVPVLIAVSVLVLRTLGTVAFWSRCSPEIGAIDVGLPIARR